MANKQKQNFKDSKTQNKSLTKIKKTKTKYDVKQKKQKIRTENAKLAMFSKGEEIFSAVTHIVGAAFAIFATIAMIFVSVEKQNSIALTSSIIYGSCMLILFLASSLYHFLRENKAKRLFRILDHCAIFLLIAGTYTPFCLITLNGTLMGIITLAFVWTLAIVGVTLNAINMHNKVVMVISQISYILMGWCVILSITPLLQALHINGFWWLLAGGLAYTAGVAFFALGKKVKYFHPIWHLWVLTGCVTQFVSVYVYVLLPL